MSSALGNGVVEDESSGGPEVIEAKEVEKMKLVGGDSPPADDVLSADGGIACGVDPRKKRNAADRRKCGESSLENKRILRSDVAKQREREIGALVEGRKVLRSDAAKRKKEPDSNSTGNSSADNGSDVTGLEELEKEVLRLDAAEGRGVSETHKDNTEENCGKSGRNVGEETGVREKKPKEGAVGTIEKIGGSSDDKQVNPEEIKLENKITGSDVDQQGVESNVGEKEVSQVAHPRELKDIEEDAAGLDNCGNDTGQIESYVEFRAEKKRVKKSSSVSRGKGAQDIRAETKRITRSCNVTERDLAGSSEKKVTDSSMVHAELKFEEESEIKEKRVPRLDVAKKRKKADTVPQEVSESGVGRKRSGEACSSDTIRKKLRVEPSGSCQDWEMQEKSWRKKNIKQKTSRSDGNDNTRHKGEKMLSRGVLKSLSGHTKVEGFEKSHIQRKTREDNLTVRASSSSEQDKFGNPSLQGGRGKQPRSSSNVPFGKSHLIMKKTSSAEKISHVTKNRLKPNTSNRKNEFMIKGESGSSLETPFSPKDHKENAMLERKAAKQKIREQIKGILLSAGWKIDLRPRKGRGYDDTVYISPKGSGYWSVLKAYEVFQRQMNRKDDGKDGHLSRKQFEKSKSSHNLEETCSAFSVIPPETLSILKKVMVNKRRSKAEMEEEKKKLVEGIKNKKAKLANGLEPQKITHLKHNDRKAKGRKKKTNILPSSNMGIISHINKKKCLEGDRRKQRRMALLARGSNQEAKEGTHVCVPYLGKRTIFSWMIDLGIMPATGKLNYMNQDKTHSMMDGWITRNGIHCSCCSRILTVSMFEIHAGSKLCQPYQNIYLEEAGISLLQCQLNAWEEHDASVRQSFYFVDTCGDDPNDDTCGICGDGGDLICCDCCPSTFHLSCLGIQRLPTGNWHCMNCSCKFCGLVSSSDAEEHGAAFSPTCSCYQCGKKYHYTCGLERDAIPASSNLPSISYCGQSCKKLFEQLQRLIGVKNDLAAGFSWTLLQRLDEDFSDSICRIDQKVECNSKIAVAHAVMDECFVPIIDQRSGINLIHNVVYNCGSNFSRLNYRGFYTLILEREDEIISTASLRIHGTNLAEMPFIGTRNIYRRQGMCRRLLNGIESLLCSLSIEKLIIPAIPELLETWTDVFGFKAIEVSDKQELRSINMLVFPGTGLLSKPLLREDSTKHCKTADRAETVESDREHHHTSEVANGPSVQSFLSLELNASDEVSVQCEHNVKDTKQCASDVSPMFSDVPHGTEPQALGCLSAEIPSRKDLLVCPDVVYHDQLLVDSNFRVPSSEPESKLLAKDSAHDNSIMKVGGACVIANLHPDGTLAKLTADTKSTSPDYISSPLHDSVADTTIVQSTANSMLMTQHAARYGESEMADTSNVVIPVENETQISSEHTMVNNVQVQHEVCTQLNFGVQLGNGNAECAVGPLDGVKQFLASTELNIHTTGWEKIQCVQKVQLAPVKPELLADDRSAEQYTFEDSKTPLDVAFGKESQDSCMRSASCDTDTISIHACFLHSDEMSIQCNSLQQRPIEGPCNPGLSFDADKLQINKHDLVDLLNGTSLS